MAHMIDQSHGHTSMAYRGETPWHNLGTKINDGTTAVQALTIAYLDWEVATRPNYFESLVTKVGDDGEPKQVPFYKKGDGHQVVRLDTHQTLGNVGDEYTPIQNKHWARVADKVMPTGFDIETAFALEGGKKVGFLFRQNEKLQLAGDDHHQYFLWLNDHTGRRKARIFSTYVRCVCWNTVNLALGALSKDDKKGIVMRHTKNVNENLFNTRRMVELLGNDYQIFNEAFTRMRETKVAGREIVPYFKKVLGINRPGVTLEDFNDWPKRTRDRIMEMGEFYRDDPTQQDIKGTAYGLFQAVTGVHARQDYSKQADKDDADARERKALSYTERTVGNRNEKALRLALALVEDRPTAVAV